MICQGRFAPLCFVLATFSSHHRIPRFHQGACRASFGSSSIMFGWSPVTIIHSLAPILGSVIPLFVRDVDHSCPRAACTFELRVASG